MNDDIQDPLKAVSEIYQPDPRQPNLVGDLSDNHAALSEIVLHDQVPANVRQLFETAKNVSLYSWFVYRFHQVAEGVAYSALEMALRERAGLVEWSGPNAPTGRGLKKLLRHAQNRGWLKNEGFSSARRMAAERARLDKVLIGIEAGKDFAVDEPSEEEISVAMGKIDYIEILIEHAPKMRNQLAHGSSVLSPRSPQTLTIVAQAINQLFVRSPGSL
jgi:hypothetical protein